MNGKVAGLCDRCNKPHGHATLMSRFNTDVICAVCVGKERQHPEYKKACEVEIDEIRKGNYNFEGIGLPDDLKV